MRELQQHTLQSFRLTYASTCHTLQLLNVSLSALQELWTGSHAAHHTTTIRPRKPDQSAHSERRARRHSRGHRLHMPWPRTGRHCYMKKSDCTARLALKFCQPDGCRAFFRELVADSTNSACCSWILSWDGNENLDFQRTTAFATPLPWSPGLKGNYTPSN